ncbi:MAG: hypothetical protein AAF485_19285, partial [Chloroflexota bacterium]
SLFYAPQHWGIVIEIFGFSPRSGIPDIHIYTFASVLDNRESRQDYVTKEAYKAYLANNPYNESRFITPFDDDAWIDEEYVEYIQLAGSYRLRGREEFLPTLNTYQTHGIILEETRPQTFEFCRLVAHQRRDDILATETELRSNLLPEMKKLLELDEWFHPDLAGDERPSHCETFQQIAQVLITGESHHYQPTQVPNTHWKHWPEGGTL